MNDWISWFYHPVPEDVKGLLIKYDDGIFPDQYDFETKKRKYREGHMILGWKFMERSNPDEKNNQCKHLNHNTAQLQRSKRENFAYCTVCMTNSREPEKGAGHYCHECKEYDYASMRYSEPGGTP